MDKQSLYLLIALSPLVGSAIAGLFGWAIGRRPAHVITILGVAVSCAGSFMVLNDLLELREPLGVKLAVGFGEELLLRHHGLPQVRVSL